MNAPMPDTKHGAHETVTITHRNLVLLTGEVVNREARQQPKTESDGANG